MLLGIPGQIEKLGGTIRDIQSVLADAERKQSNDKTIERWLKKLKDVLYDADDVIDLCQIKARERLAGCGFPLLVRNPLQMLVVASLCCLASAICSSLMRSVQKSRRSI